jgi:predicted dienelactone hydrolase
MLDPSAPGSFQVGEVTMTFTRTSTTTGQPRPLPTTIWYPVDADQPAGQGARPATTGGPFPVVVFSHGNGNNPRSLLYFVNHLASWGFVVAAPAHTGNTSADCHGHCSNESIVDSAQNRPDDVEFVLAEVRALRSDPAQPLGAVVDEHRAALTGFSFGGYTTLAAMPSGLFDAGLEMSGGPYQALHSQAAATHAPMMLMQEAMGDQALGGAGAAQVDELAKLSDAFPATVPRYSVIFPGADHDYFSDHCTPCPGVDGVHRFVDGYGVAFLLEYVKGDTRFAAYLRNSQPPDATISQAGP